MIKKLLAVFLLTSLLVACGETDVEDLDTSVEENEDGANTEQEDETTTENEDTRQEDASVVILDEAGVKVTYTGISIKNDEIFGREAKINLEIENTTDKLVTVQQRNMSVDGFMVDDTILSFSEDVAAGKAAKSAITISEFEGYEFPEFNENIEFDIVVIDGESWENIVEKAVNITVNSNVSSENGSAETPEDTNAQVLVDENDIKISYTGLNITDDETFGREAKINLIIENNSDKLVTVQQRNLSVDGFMVDETILSFSQDVKPGKKAKTAITVSEFEGYDFPEFTEDLTFDLVVLDGESWEDMLESPVTIEIE